MATTSWPSSVSSSSCIDLIDVTRLLDAEEKQITWNENKTTIYDVSIGGSL
jgi:hypothetical protein